MYHWDSVNKRACAICGLQFDAVGLTAICDDCEAKSAKREPKVYAMGKSWPALHVAHLELMCGPGLDMAKRLAAKVRTARIAVLSGDRGRGKTQIATYCAWSRAQNGMKPGRYTRTYDMCESIVGYDRVARLRGYQNPPFLVVDESHMLTASQAADFQSVIDDRYADAQPALILGNWPDEAAILACLGHTVMDRVNEMGGVVWCHWPSYRTDH